MTASSASPSENAAATSATPPPGCPAHQGARSLSGPGFQTNPFGVYGEMRGEHGPVAPVLLDGDIPGWLVLGYRELHQVTSDDELFTRDANQWNQWANIPENWPLAPMISRDQTSVVYATGEDHQRRAEAIAEALDAVDPYELRRHAEHIADGLVDEFCHQGEAELIADYARLLPELVLARIYGIPDAEGPALVQAMNDAVDGTGNPFEAYQHVYMVMRQLASAKRTAPAPDVASRLVAAYRGYPDELVAQDLIVIMTAGHQPTADWIGNTLRLLLTDERFALSLSGGRHSVGQAMNEVLWEDTPVANLAARWATRDTTLAGKYIRKGDLLILGFHGANTDPLVRPDTQAFTEGNNAFLSFGHGEHRCPHPAQEIAETIAKTAVEVLLDRLPDVRLAVPRDTLLWRPSAWVRGLSALPVAFSPAPRGGR
ncbi:cytochrome P450 [Streptomyces sp. NPDC019937]|uniref:cytochrome P450 n=1 Tax=Streptomyces sp. NPDC019937 TaxID=3154787 RepID=UPI0033DF84A9